MLDVPVLTGSAPTAPAVPWHLVRAERAQLDQYRALRREVFVREQGIFDASDHDRIDDDPRTIVLVAIADTGEVLGGVRIAPAVDGRDIGWWTGSRLVVRSDARRAGGIGAALVREACATALTQGVLRFEATVQTPNEVMFRRLGWQSWGRATIGDVPHVRMRWPIDRIRELVTATKMPLGELIGDLRGDGSATLGGDGFVGDDGAPVPGTDVVAACDGILPALIDRDPEWAGWCGVLVNVNDLSAMGAAPVGLVNAVGGRNASTVRRVIGGLRSGASAWGIPILGGHTQLNVASSLSVTALGRSPRPVPGGGGRAGHDLTLTADLHGRWRRGFEGRQWDSTSTRTAAELRHLHSLVSDAQPRAAKDVSMAGIIGTAAMLAEASGVGAAIDVARVPAPAGVAFGDWLTCFPGFGMLTADQAGSSRMLSPLATSATIGTLVSAPGITLRWPDGVETVALDRGATGLGTAVSTK